MAEPSLRPACRLSSAILGFGKECGEEAVPALPVSWGSGLVGTLGPSRAEALRGWGQGTSVPGTTLDSELTNREEEEKGHLEVVTHPTGGRLGGRLKVSLRSAPVQLNYSLTRQVQALS